jgi:hypothetical protein
MGSREPDPDGFGDDDFEENEEENDIPGERSGDADSEQKNLDSNNISPNGGNTANQEVSSEEERKFQEARDEDYGHTVIKVGINVGKTEGSSQVIGVVKNYYYASDTFRWKELGETLGKIGKVLIASSRLVIPASFEPQRIIIVDGSVHTGRYSLALHLARQLVSDNRKAYSLQCTANSSIFDFLFNDLVPKSGVFILRNAFDNSAQILKDLLESATDIFQLLEEQDAVLILTTHNPVSYPPEILTIHSVQLSTDELVDVFTRHISSHIYKIADNLVAEFQDRKFLGELVSILKTPSNINRLISALAREPNITGNIRSLVREKAEGIGKAEVNLEAWFQKMEERERYFAFTVMLFPDLSVEDLFRRFVTDNSILRESKFNLGLALDLNFSQYMENTHCRVSEWGNIEFEEPKFLSDVASQYHENYFFHFGKLYELYSHEVITHSSKDDIPTRLAYCHALGEMGKTGFKQLSQVLAIWGKSNQNSIRAATGYALQQVCTDTSQTGNVEELLLSWAQEDQKPGLRWTAIAAGERLYSSVPDVVLEIIEQSREDWDYVGPIFHSLMSIARIDMPEVVSLLIDWLADKGQPVSPRTAKRISSKLLNGLKPNNDHRRQALLPLAESMLAFSETTCKETMSILKAWIYFGSNPHIVDDVGKLISSSMEAVDQILQNVILRTLEQDWLREKNVKVASLARQLLAFHRKVTEALGLKSAIVILDISEETPEIQKQMDKFFLGITKYLDAFRIKCFALGDCSPAQQIFLKSLIDGTGAFTQRSSIMPARLIGPILSALDIDKTLLTLVITAGSVPDLVDWNVSDWTKNTIINQFRPNLERVEGFKYISSTSVKEVVELLESEYYP